MKNYIYNKIKRMQMILIIKIHLSKKKAGHLPGDVPETLWAVAASFFVILLQDYRNPKANKIWQDLLAA